MQFVYSELFIHEENQIKLRLFEESLWDGRTDECISDWNARYLTVLQELHGVI